MEDMRIFDLASKEFIELKRTMKFYLTVDLAGTGEKYSDYTALVVCGVTPQYDIFVVDSKQVKIDLTKSNKIIDLIFKYADRWKVQKIGIERGVLERALWKPMRDRIKFKIAHGKKIPYTLKRLKFGSTSGISSRNKDERIGSMSNYTSAGIIHVGKHNYDLIEALLKWRPNSSSHDDLPDALSFQFQVIPCRIPAEKMEKKEESRTWRYLKRRRKEVGRVKGKNFAIDFINEGIRRM
jgi:phage terminase large subunit-like protein